MNRGRVFGRLIITTCRQAVEAPLIDGCMTVDDKERRYGGMAIRLGPNDRPSIALVIGWRDARMPNLYIWRLRLRIRFRQILGRDLGPQGVSISDTDFYVASKSE